MRTVASEGSITTPGSTVTRVSSASKSSGEGSNTLSSVIGTLNSAAVLVGVNVRSATAVE